MMEKKILIPVSEGKELHGVCFLSTGENVSKKAKRNPLVILCHGFTGDKYEWGRFLITAKALNEASFDALIFDFSGSGENQREFITLSKQAKDLEDVFAWVKNEGYMRIAVIGLSFGGLTVLVANLMGVKTYIFWAPAFYMNEIFLSNVKESLRKSPLELPSSGDGKPIKIDYTFIEDISKYEITTYLKSLSTPVLIVQGTKDRSVNPAHTRKAFENLPQDDHHKLIEIEKATHNFDAKYLKQFIEVSQDWLKKYI
jgi:esterase/lipase